MYFNTDKILPHGYFQTYARIAGVLGPAARVCELGVLDGEGLRILQSLFPLGEIFGVDSNEHARWPEGTVKVVSDQAAENLPERLTGLFDLIVDDASHEEAPTRGAFTNLWPLVAPGGYYVVEDWAVALNSRAQWGDGMLRFAESLLPMLDRRDGECESITYRYGLIIVRKSAKVPG